MAEIDLVSSHTPWTPLPQLVPWSQLGDGSVYDGMHASHTSFFQLLGGPDQQRDYARSIQYSLRSLVSFVRHAARQEAGDGRARRPPAQHQRQRHGRLA